MRTVREAEWCAWRTLRLHWTARAVVLFVPGFPVMALSSDASFEQLLADLDTLRVEHDVPGFALTLVPGSGGLQTGAGGVADRDSGRAVTAQLFRREGQPLATIAIAVQDGERYLQADFGNYRQTGELP
jgi:hypothetical protein